MIKYEIHFTIRGFCYDQIVETNNSNILEAISLFYKKFGYYDIIKIEQL